MTKRNFSWNSTTMGASSLLYQEEGDALLSILTRLMEERLECPTKGDLMLYGQRWRGCSIQIASCVMSGGHGSQTYLGNDYSTEELATKAVSSALSFPNHEYQGKTDDRFTSWPITGIYDNHAGLQALVLNCAKGRFLASCYADFSESHPYATIEALMAITTTLSYLRPHDHKLKESCKQIWDSLDAEITNEIADITSWVTNAFYDSRASMIQDWRKWRKKFDDVAELPAYFDEASVIPAM